MSTDIIPLPDQLYIVRRRLAESRAKQAQAEDAQRLAEELTRRQKNRAQKAENERDGWRMLTRDLLVPRLLDHQPELSQRALDQITDLAHDLHGQGIEVTDNILRDLADDWSSQ